MKILKAIIIVNNGPDKIFLHTNLPCPYIPESGMSQNAILELECSHTYGEKYLKKHFANVPYEIINVNMQKRYNREVENQILESDGL